MLSSKINLSNTKNPLENEIRKEYIASGLSGSADDDLDGPSRAEGFKVFSPSAIKSSLLRKSSIKQVGIIFLKIDTVIFNVATTNALYPS
jgi:hypothetical protein